MGKAYSQPRVWSETTRQLRERTSKVIVNGWSMYPALRPGDILLVDSSPSSRVRPGTIVVFQVPDKNELVVHRVTGTRINEGRQWYMTRGDNNRHTEEKVSPEWIVGTASHRINRKGVGEITRVQELFYLCFSPVLRIIHSIRSRLVRFAFPVLDLLINIKLVKIHRIRVGERLIISVLGRVIAVKDEAFEKPFTWVHPLFRTMPNLWEMPYDDQAYSQSGNRIS